MRIFPQKWLLCVDPESRQIYSLNLKTRIIKIEEDVPTQYRERAYKDIDEIQKLIQLPSSKWNHSYRAERFRRRRMCEYLLHKIVSQDPMYLSESHMSDAFKNVSSFKLVVNLCQYIISEDDSLNPLSIEMNVDLTMSAEQVIDKIKRAVLNRFQVRLAPQNPQNQFILQIAGVREFLSGNYSMLQYDRVRMSLRGIQYLEVYLTERCRISKVHQSFPPIFDRIGMQPVPWDKLMDIPVFLFYPPEQLDPYMASVMTFQEGPRQIKQPQLQPRLFLKQRCLDFNEIRLKSLEQFSLKQTLYSGECDFPFHLQLVALTNVHRILLLDDKEAEESIKNYKRRATYNGICPPRYITKESAKQEELHNTAKKKNKVEDDHKKDKTSFLKFSKPKEPDPNYKNLLSKQEFNPHLMNHGNNGSANMQYLESRFELDVAPYLIQIQIILLYGQTQLTKDCSWKSKKIPFRKLNRFDEKINFNIRISQLPMEVRMAFNILIYDSSGDSQIIGCTQTEMFDDNGKLKQGDLNLNIWPFYKIDPRLICMQEYYGNGMNHYVNQDYYCKLMLKMPKFSDEVIWSLRDERYMKLLGFPAYPLVEHVPQEPHMQNASRRSTIINMKQRQWKEAPTVDEIHQVARLLKFDPLIRNTYTDQEKYLLVKCRHEYKHKPNSFAVFLCGVNWSDPEQVKEVYHVMQSWKPSPQEALPLLDAGISDEHVRYYATQKMAKFRDDELVLFMLELTQALIFEQSHFSALCEMLIERSLMNPWIVGHELFWQLRSQLHIQPSYERYCLILEQLMMLFGSYRNELLAEVQVNDEIMQVAEMVKVESEDKRKQEMQCTLGHVREKFASTFQFAIDPRMNTKGFIIEKCSILNSKKLPLWLVMQASEIKQPSGRCVSIPPELLQTLKKQKEDRKRILTEKMLIIFKCGDDIRQDLLTLQLIKIMDKIWLDLGIDFRMKPYKVISTLDQVGMIEVVLDSDTTSKIHEDAGKLGSLSKNSILEYLKKFNPTPQSIENAIENFVRSCAGYCVATYILGIGDRHSGNIMLTQEGHLFHIDFGHFLGNFKTKGGFNRERSPFVFTQEMAYVLGGVNAPNFIRFEEFCTKGYNEVRRHGHFLLNIFLMMLSAGMPELQEVSDIDYLKEKLQLHIEDQQATELFKKEIRQSLNDRWRQIDNFIHNLKRT